MPKPKAPDLRVYLAENLRVERARRKLTQEVLAEKAGISRVYIGQIERAEFACTVDVLGQLSAALGIDAPLLISKPMGPGSREG